MLVLLKEKKEKNNQDCKEATVDSCFVLIGAIQLSVYLYKVLSYKQLVV